MSQHPNGMDRRTFLRLCAAAAPAPALLLAASAPDLAAGRLGTALGSLRAPRAFAQDLPPTPACTDGGAPTVAQTEGPYFKPNSPERASLLEPGVDGTRLVVQGYVLTRGCAPVAGALLDFWQADAAGRYDNAGTRLRGHQFADAAGRYTLETIVPGLYTGRTRHLHVKVQAPGQPVLTTQLYFPDEPRNARDGIFRRELVMATEPQGEGVLGTFDFVLDLA